MTMHLMPIYYNNNNNKRRKQPFKKLKNKTKNAGIKAPNYKELSRALPTSDYTGPVVGKSKQNTYTGTFITGIATMHKSNMVPVSKNADAKEYATMRRN